MNIFNCLSCLKTLTPLCVQPLLLTWWWLDRLQAGVDAAVVAATFMTFTLRV